MRLGTAVALAASLSVMAGCGKGGDEKDGEKKELGPGEALLEPIARPKAEVAVVAEPVDLPAVPEFPAPKLNADGTIPPRTLRLVGTRYLQQEIRVRGHVTWIYDCTKTGAAGLPNTPADRQRKMIADRPELCQRPQFALGDGAYTEPEDSILVVEVPRPPRPDELKSMSKADLDKLPPVPKIAVGDQVIVTGKWATKSPHGFQRADGLLVYESIEKATDATMP